MNTFVSIHQADPLGTLSMFDRLIFKGYLTGLFPAGVFARYMSQQGVEFDQYVTQATQTIKGYRK